MAVLNSKKYYLGLDIGTDSVGYAVTDLEYNLIKYKGNAMWGVCCFDAATGADSRRGFRTARRRLDRKQVRVQTLRELFASEIEKVDPEFYIRIKESALYQEDKNTNSKNVFFNDKGYTDKDYYKDYPTIHHLIWKLMNADKPYDIRLLYNACAYILAHRGHFLIDVSKDNIDSVKDFTPIYNEFMECMANNDFVPWECDAASFGDVLKKKLNITKKTAEFKEKLWGNKKFTCSDDENLFCKPEDLIKLVSGGKVKLSALFINNEYDELEKNSITLSDKEFEQVLDQLCGNIDEEQYELILKAKAVYDWALLADILKDHNYISEAKVAVYEKHKNDLEFLKYFVKKYTPEKYNEIFKEISEKSNYVFYSRKFDPVKDEAFKKIESTKNVTQEDFCKYIKGIVSNVKVSDEDKERYDKMLADLENVSFCPKQVTGDNRVIPYQLYWIELKTILDKAEMFFPFLKQKDEYCTVSEKILSLMEFRVPYYVGPLVSKDKSQFAWMVKKADAPSEKIYPWNFDKIVDKDESEEAFINRMTCKCTYCAGEDVLPKCSLLYSEFTVLNTINSIKINDVPITTECKQAIFTECFEKFRRVTKKKITEMLIANGYMTKKDEISGIDDTIGASLSSYHDFKRLIENNVITKADAENIIKRITFAQDRNRLKKWLRGKYNFSDADLNYVAGLKYKDFGRLSEKLLTGYRDIVDGEERNPSIIEMLRNTNENLMQLLSDKYTYSEQIESDNRAYYAEHPLSLNKRLDEMYIPNAVKRPIIRTLDIVKEVCSLMGGQPEKIFVEMARGATEEQKNKRTKSRREQITEWYLSERDNCLMFSR